MMVNSSESQQQWKSTAMMVNSGEQQCFPYSNDGQQRCGDARHSNDGEQQWWLAAMMVTAVKVNSNDGQQQWLSQQWWSTTFTFWGKSCTKDSFSHFHLSVFEESLAWFVFTFSPFSFWGKSCTKALFSHLPLSLLEGSLARKLRFHIFNCHFLREVSHDISGWVTVALRCCCTRSSMVFCNLLLANRIGMAAPKLRRGVFDDFTRFGRLPFPF